MDELPHWRVVMRREREGGPITTRAFAEWASEHAEAIVEMRAILRERGTVSNRDFEMATRTRTQSYRGRKDSALALYYLWRTGEVMTHHRENFERVYALTETVAPAHLIRESERGRGGPLPDQKGNQLLRPVAAEPHGGCVSPRRAVQQGEDRSSRRCWRTASSSRCRWRAGRRCTTRSAATPGLLDDLSAGRVPQAWTPLETTTTEEVVFLAPLDPVSARGRAKVLFGFDYVWEVYKPEHQRKFGYYTLPILWGDRLVARFDSKLDRTTNTFVILGLWLEDEALGKDEAFAEALARGFARFVAFLGAEKLEAETIGERLAEGICACLSE